MLLYIHVPFCRKKCNYCAFHSTALEKGVDPLQSEAIRSYVDSLFLELAYYGDYFAGREVSSIFFGGGTPSLLPSKIIDVLIGRINKIFKLKSSAEITLEANPESLRSLPYARDLLKAGVNRLSLGVQSLDDEYLRALGRAHKAKDSFQSIRLAREAGFANISVDLMWALPDQSIRQWLNTLKEITRLKPDHISSYGLTLEEGTPLECDYREGIIELPPERDQSIMFIEGAGLLEEQGYLHYEISNFARMGFQCKHNIGYWEGDDYLGFGPSATSTIDGRRWTNPLSQRKWTDAIKTRSLDKDAEKLDANTRVLELIMLRLRTSRGLRLKAYQLLTGRNFLADHKKLIQALHENGLIRIRAGYLRLTRSGMLVSNSILSNLFSQTENILTAGDSKEKLT